MYVYVILSCLTISFCCVTVHRVCNMIYVLNYTIFYREDLSFKTIVVVYDAKASSPTVETSHSLASWH